VRVQRSRWPVRDIDAVLDVVADRKDLWQPRDGRTALGKRSMGQRNDRVAHSVLRTPRREEIKDMLLKAVGGGQVGRRSPAALAGQRSPLMAVVKAPMIAAPQVGAEWEV
jgi:hypothetical protein